MKDTYDKWRWKMNYCFKKRIQATQAWAWDQAERAYNEQSVADQKKAEEEYHTLQQLQTKIRALVEEFCNLYDGNLNNEAVSLLLTELRKLYEPFEWKCSCNQVVIGDYCKCGAYRYDL